MRTQEILYSLVCSFPVLAARCEAPIFLPPRVGHDVNTLAPIAESNWSMTDSKSDEEKMKNMETFIRSFHNGDYDTEFDDALCVDRSIISFAQPMTQASYDKPNNWVERNRIGLEGMNWRLQTCIDSLAWPDLSCSFDLDLLHNSYGHQLMDNEYPIVWHEPILDEYWDQLEAKMNEQNTEIVIQKIHIMNVEMRKERLAALVNICHSGKANSSSAYIQFNNANLCAEGIVWLSKLVDVSSEIQTLYLLHNRINNMESACCLARSLKSHMCINQLYLHHCDLGSSPEILLVVLQSDVKYINLISNNIDTLGAIKIAEYLEGNPPISHIDLDRNRFNDDDAVLISQALKKNTNLHRINLHSNNFTSIGVKALLTCVFDGSSLNAISESNHTMKRLILFHSHHFNLAGCIDGMLTLDRTDKTLPTNDYNRS
jgi:hypothetical protein